VRRVQLSWDEVSRQIQLFSSLTMRKCERFAVMAPPTSYAALHALGKPHIGNLQIHETFPSSIIIMTTIITTSTCSIHTTSAIESLLGSLKHERQRTAHQSTLPACAPSAPCTTRERLRTLRVHSTAPPPQRPGTAHRAPLPHRSIRALRTPLPRESVRARRTVDRTHARTSVHCAQCTTPTPERRCTAHRAPLPRQSVRALRTVHHSHAGASVHFASCTTPTHERLHIAHLAHTPTREHPHSVRTVHHSHVNAPCMCAFCSVHHSHEGAPAHSTACTTPTREHRKTATNAPGPRAPQQHSAARALFPCSDHRKCRA
jgi:hypothetical protein